MKKVFKTFIMFVIAMFIFLQVNCYATTIEEDETVKEGARTIISDEQLELEAGIRDIKGITDIIPQDLLDEMEKEAQETGNISEETLVKVLEAIEENATSEKVISVIDENDDVLKDMGLSDKFINVIKESVQSDMIDLSELAKSSIGYIKDVQAGVSEDVAFENNFSTNQMISILTALLVGTNLVGYLIAIVAVVFVIIYILDCIILWRVFEKAGQKGWKGLIPIYRQVVYLEVCKYNPWVILVAFIPFVGPSLYSVIKQLSKMRLSDLFGHGLGFAMGLVLLPHIFGLILAFDDDKYLAEDNKNLAQFNAKEFN